MNSRSLAMVLGLLLFGFGATNVPSAAAQYQQGPPPPPPQGYGQNGYGEGGKGQGGYRQGGQGDWDAPPQEYNDVRRQGYHAGIEAARQDFQTQQRPRPEQHREFRHPQVPPQARDDFRDAFRKGYYAAMHHMRDGDHNHDGPR